METILADVRYAARMLARSPGFTAVAVLTLALGIGANTTMFSLMNAVLLRPLPFPAPERLVTVWKGRVSSPTQLNIVSLPNYRDWKERSRVFADLALLDSAGRGYNLTGGSEPEQVSGVRVTASFFTVLGVRPLLGRTFLAEEEDPGRDRVVVLSYGLWTRRYGGEASLVGKTIPIDGQDRTVVGVMPPQFQFQAWGGPRELWVPAGWTKGDREGIGNSFISIGRLAPGVGLEQARAEMDAIGRALAREKPQDNEGWTARVVPMNEYGVRDMRQGLSALQATVGFVLLIACVNVANLMLARAASRHRELAIRSALGAGRLRIVRQLLTESLLLGILGGAGGLLLASWSISLLPQLVPRIRFVPFRPVDAIRVDGTVLLFTIALSALAGILFGLAPAYASLRGDLSAPLKESARGSTQGGRSRLRHALVASEVALTLIVLAGAGLMITSVARLVRVDPGLDARNVLLMEMSLPQEDLYNGPPDHPRFCQALEEQAGSLPGVLSVSAIAHPPLGFGGAGRAVMVEGRPDPGRQNRPGADYSVACPHVLRTLGIPLLQGREFTAGDIVAAPGVALVDEAMARRFWPGEDAVGKRFKIDADEQWITVVGVFGDVHHWGLDVDPRASFLRPYSQAAWPWMHIVVKTASAPAPFVNPVKKALAAIEPDQPVARVQTMKEVVESSTLSRRFPMLLLSGFALLALALAAVGIAGVVGYSVVQRTREIGVRIALGAQSRDVLGLVVGGSLWWSLAGVAAGLVASVGLLRFLSTLLYGVTPLDPTVLGAVSLLLLAVALGASYLPARRAARVDPVVALRYE